MKIEKTNLEEFQKSLEDKGYRRFNGHYKKEDHGYWKSFHISFDEYDEKEREYQIAFLIYDFTKYDNYDKKDVSVQFEFLLSNDQHVSRMDFTISDDDMTVEKFEEISEKLYQDIYVNYIKLHTK